MPQAPAYNAENEAENKAGNSIEEENLAESVYGQLIHLVKHGSTEKVQLQAISLALQFIRDLDLESEADSDDDRYAGDADDGYADDDDTF